MGFYATTSRIAGNPTSKAICLFWQVSISGFRSYSPRLGRWGNRDPIEEEGAILLYDFCLNSPTTFFDPTGESILSLEVRGSNIGWIEGLWPNKWKDSFSEDVWKDIGQGASLGFKMGTGYISTSPFNIFWSSNHVTSALWKWELKAIWCKNTSVLDVQWQAFLSDFKIVRLSSSGASTTIENQPNEVPDGPSGLAVSMLDPLLINSDGTYTTYAWDAPRWAPAFHNPKKYRWYFFGTWRVRIEDPATT